MFFSRLGDGVSTVAHQASADWLMSVGVTHGVDATHSRARVHALVQVANLVITAVWVHFALD